MHLEFHKIIVEFYNCNFIGITTCHYEIIDCTYSNITMTNKTVRDSDGPFMKTKGCNLRISDSDFRNNKELRLFSDSSNITVMNVTVRDNEGDFMETEDCTVLITNSHFRNNKALELLFFYQRSSADVINSTFTGNLGLNRGTLTIESSDLTTEGCQFLKNTVKTKGAALCVRDGTYNDHSSLFAENAAVQVGKILNQQY